MLCGGRGLTGLQLGSGEKRPFRTFCLVLILLLAGCGGESGSSDSSRQNGSIDLPEPILWDTPDIEPPQAPFIQRMPDLADVSTWADRISAGKAQKRKPSHMPYLGTGNGSVSCLLGTTLPFSTIHSLFGPTYQKDDLYLAFPDIRWTLRSGGVAVSSDEETIWRVRKTAVIITRSRIGTLGMWTVTFAPYPTQWPGETAAQNRILFRLVYVRNSGPDSREDLSLAVRLPGAWGRVSEGTLVSESGARMLRIVPIEAQGTASGRALVLPLAMETGEEAVMAFALVTSSPAFPEEPVLETLNGLTAAGIEAKLMETVFSWRYWYDQGVHVNSPDPRVNDLMEGLAVTDKIQTTITGGPVEMSHYSLVWNRDTYGPMRMFTATGRAPEARGILDYHFAAVRYRGGLANAYDADLDPATAPPPPTAQEWAAMGTFSGRTAAEGPSFLVLDYDRYLQMKGDLADFEPQDLAARLDMLRACVYQQALTEDGLLPFSGDETFRPQMAISFGLGIEYPFEDQAWSFSSGVLLVAAAEALARIEEAAADVLGNDPTEAVRRAMDLAEQVRETTLVSFWNPSGGYFEPFLLRPDNEPARAPYGDVDAVPFWVGVDFPGVDQQSIADVLVHSLLSRHKVFFSPADPLLGCLLGSLIGEGIYTGMTPGFTLWTLASVFHPEAMEVFNALDDHADPGGNYPEVVAHDDTSAMMPIYDDSGITGELWARYRSWEGGINAEAILYYLTGFLADAVQNVVQLAPQLANNWPYLQVTGLKIGQALLDLSLERTSMTGMRLTLYLEADSALTARIRIPGPLIESARLNGTDLDTGTRLGLEWGGTATDLGEQVLQLGQNQLVVEFWQATP